MTFHICLKHHKNSQTSDSMALWLDGTVTRWYTTTTTYIYFDFMVLWLDSTFTLIMWLAWLDAWLVWLDARLAWLDAQAWLDKWHHQTILCQGLKCGNWKQPLWFKQCSNWKRRVSSVFCLFQLLFFLYRYAQLYCMAMIGHWDLLISYNARTANHSGMMKCSSAIWNSILRTRVGS